MHYLTEKTKKRVRLPHIMRWLLVFVIAGSLSGRAASEPPVPSVTWYPSIADAIAENPNSQQPMLLFVWHAEKRWDDRMRTILMEDASLGKLLKDYLPVSIRMPGGETTADAYGIRETPALAILTPSGRVAQSISGFQDTAGCRQFLLKGLGASAGMITMTERMDALKKIARAADSLSEADWVNAFSGMGAPAWRPVVSQAFREADPFPGRACVKQLTHPRLAVRLGALEILEERAGDSFAFDPWQPVSAASVQALARWEKWLEKPAQEEAKIFAAISLEDVQACLADLACRDWSRGARARRRLLKGGDAAVAAIGAYLTQHPQLSPGKVKLLKEVQFAASLQKAVAVDGERLARQLCFGDLDARLAAIPELTKAGLDAVPILRELLPSPEALIREAVADALGTIGGNTAVIVLAEHLKTESDIDVMITIAGRLGKTETRRSMNTLNRLLKHEDEDVRVAALEALAKFGNKLAVNKDLLACLDDSSWRVRAAVVTCLGMTGKDLFAKHVLASLQDEDAFVCTSAVTALSRMDVKEHLDTLEKIYLEKASLRPAIMPLLVGSKPLSAKVLNSLEEENPDILQQMMSRLSEQSEDFGGFGRDTGKGERLRQAQERIAAAILQKSNPELKAVAFASYAKLVRKSASARARTVQALSDPSRQVRMETLRALELDLIPGVLARSHQKKTGSPPGPDTQDAGGEGAVDELMDLFADPEAAKPAPSQSAAEPSSSDAVDELMDLFGPDESAKSPAQTDSAPPPETSPGDPVDSLADAFGLEESTQSVVPGEGQESQPELHADLMDVFNALVTAHQQAADREEKALAAYQLTTAGSPEGLADLVDGRVHLSAQQARQLVPKLFLFDHRPEAAQIVRDILSGSDQDLQQSLFEQLLRAGKPDQWMEWLFAEMGREGSGLSMEDLPVWQINSLRQTPHKLKPFFPFAMALAANPDVPPLKRAVAFYFLLGRKDPKLGELIDTTLDHDHAALRMMSLIQLGLTDFKAFENRWPKILKDPSPNIRSLVPMMITGGRAAAGDSDAAGFFVDDETTLPIFRRILFSERDTVTQHLKELTHDRSQDVQLPAFLAQAVLGQPVDQEALRRLIASRNQPESLSHQLISYRQRRVLKRKSPETARLLGTLLPENFDDWVEENELETASKNDTNERLPPSLTEMADQFVVSNSPAETTDHQQDSTTRPPKSAEGEVIETNGSQPSTPVKLVVFFKPGCSDCRKLGEWLKAFSENDKTLQVEHWNINTPEGLKINRVLCDRFSVDARDRGVAPAVFSAAGARIRGQLTRQSLVDLIAAARLRGADQSWAEVSEKEENRAEQNIQKDFDKITLGVVLANGLADGINPCAFAALIFLLSYLAVTRKTVPAVLAVGLSYTLAVFLTYLCVGLGFTHVAEQMAGHPRGQQTVHFLLMAALVVLIVLSLRDAYVCFRQGAGKMALRLPGFLTRLVHSRIRRGMRARYIVPAAFATGMIVSLLELACTGQVYLPTILFVLRTSAASVPALSWLLIYNLAFILPLLVIFVLYACGLRSQTLTTWFDRHAVLAKLCLSLVFMLMLVLLILG